MLENASYLNDSAVSLASEGAHAEAIACLKRGILLEPRNGVLWFNLALSYRATGFREEARLALLRAARTNPLDVDVLDTLGVVLHELGDDSSAQQAYETALEIEPDNGRVWNNFGVLQFSKSMFPEARKSFEKAITLIPDFDDALYNLKDTYEELGMDTESGKCAAILASRGYSL